MKGNTVGIDIGASGLKLAQISGGRVVKLVIAALPENLVQGGRIISIEALAQEIKRVKKAEGIRGRRCALALPPEVTFVRKTTMPYMTAEHLKLNLPYEFHDYIQSDKESYFYDYAVLGVNHDEEDKPAELELLAAATAQPTINQYRATLRKAGLSLYTAVPEYLTYRNIIRAYEARTEEHPAEYCIADLGHSAIRVHMYRGPAYETTRVIEYGGNSLDSLIADALSIDPHMAAAYKSSNYNNVQELDACMDLYGHIALEIMRAVNFYGFNTPEADLHDIYLSGGLARVPALSKAVEQTLELKCHGIEELLPEGGDAEAAPLCAAAIGATMQGVGR